MPCKDRRAEYQRLKARLTADPARAKQHRTYMNERGAIWKKNNPEKVWKSKGMPIPTRPKPDTCENCGRSGKRLVNDHCHATGRFRGWLCNRCNVAIGLLDDLAGVTRTLQYLRKLDG